MDESCFEDGQKKLGEKRDELQYRGMQIMKKAKEIMD